MWMGIFWVGLGLFFFASRWMPRGAFLIPGLDIGLDLIVIPLGALRVWWWFKTVHEPAKRRQERQKELRELRLQNAKLAQQESSQEEIVKEES